MLNTTVPKVRLLIFDLDGTLVDSKADIVVSANLALRATGLPTFSAERITQAIGQGSENLFRQLLRQTAAAAEITTLVQQFKQIYADNLLKQTQVYPGIGEVLRHYAQLPKVVVTNKSQVFADRLVDTLELRRHFEAVFGLEAFAARKPDPEPLLEVCKRWNVHPSEAAMIGDSVFDIIAGKAAGLQTVSVLYGLGSAAELRALQPDFVVASAPELLTIF